MDWWNAAFGAAYLEVYHHRDDTQAAVEIAGLLPRLRAAPGPIVDAACGAGRHLAALRTAGLPAIGFDLSGDLLAVASRRPDCRGWLARGDLRAPPIASGCGAVLCLFTGFGYFDDQGNAACLAALAGLLAPGGWLVLDLPDPGHLRQHLPPDGERQTPGGWTVREKRRLLGRRVEKEVQALSPDGASVGWQESVRLYDAVDVAALAQEAGLEMVEAWPGLGGAADNSGRLVAWLRRIVVANRLR